MTKNRGVCVRKHRQSVRKHLRVSHIDGTRNACESRTCGYKTVTSHRELSRNAELSSFADLRLVIASQSQKCQRSQRAGGRAFLVVKHTTVVTFWTSRYRSVNTRMGGGSWSWNAGPSSPLDLLHAPIVRRRFHRNSCRVAPRLSPSAPATPHDRDDCTRQWRQHFQEASSLSADSYHRHQTRFCN